MKIIRNWDYVKRVVSVLQVPVLCQYLKVLLLINKYYLNFVVEKGGGIKILNYRLPDKVITIKNVVLDYNGTIATDGKLQEGIEELLIELSDKVNLYILTADTFGTVKKTCSNLPVTLSVVNKQAGGPDKVQLVEKLGSNVTVAIGNGRNDALMLKEAILGLLVIGEEGAAKEALEAADVIFTKAIHALNFLLNPERVIATLRP
ncbi:MAG: hypothetical protein PWP31_1796 [Clostridia bacterium]|nr:hypothetical protein [Clostridia bacterium]